MMTSDENEFDAALNRGRVYDNAAQLRAIAEGTPITDSEGRHWIRGFNDPAERRWRRRQAPRLIWVEIGGGHDRRPSSEIPLPARRAVIEDFWPTTLVEGSGIPMSIGAIAGGCVGGDPGLALWTAVENGLGALTPRSIESIPAGYVGGDPEFAFWAAAEN